MIEAPEWAVFEYRRDGVMYWCEMVHYQPRKFLKPKRTVVEGLWENVQNINPKTIEEEKQSLRRKVLNTYNARIAIDKDNSND